MRFTMSDFNCMWLVGLAMLALPACLSAEEPPSPESTSPGITFPSAIKVRAGGPEATTGMPAAILEIRTRLGFNPLAGTVLEGNSEAPEEFVAELNRLEEAQRSLPTLSPQHVNELPPAKPPTASPVVGSHSRGRPLPEAYSSIPAERYLPPAPPQPTPVPLTPDPALVDSLRNAARELDRKANDHESGNHYIEADFLRDIAHRMRDIARRHAGDSRPPATSAVLPSPR